MSNVLEEILSDYLRVPFSKKRQSNTASKVERKSMEAALREIPLVAPEGKYCAKADRYEDLEPAYNLSEIKELLEDLSNYVREGSTTIDRIVASIYRNQDCFYSTKTINLLPAETPITVLDLKCQVDGFISKLAPNLHNEYLMIARLYLTKHLLIYFFGVQIVGENLMKNWSEDGISKDLEMVNMLWKEELVLINDVVEINEDYTITIWKGQPNEFYKKHTSISDLSPEEIRKVLQTLRG